MNETKVIAQIELPPEDDSSTNSAVSAVGQNFLDTLTSYKKVFVFSPHLDDAVLSMGSLISFFSQNAIPVEVITLFSDGSPLLSTATQTLLKNAEFGDAKTYFHARREEDIRALKALGEHVTARHLNYMDSAWRSNAEGTALYPIQQLAALDPQDASIHTELVTKLKDLIKPDDQTAIFAPLARGRHVDHQLTRNTVVEVFPQTIFYEDFPYSTLFAAEDAFITERNLTGVEWKGKYEAKRKSILQYETQRMSLFLFTRGVMKLSFERYFIHNV